jgi:drug/metabolite transporter (DMT)-like permease
MSILILTHVVTGLGGIASGLIVLVGTFLRKRMPGWNALFLLTTAAACATGLVFLPIDGVTSAQVVDFFSVFLLVVATYARYVRRLHGGWNQVYAVTAIAAVFLNVLIATAQSFLHFRLLKAVAPSQRSPVFVAVKVTLLSLCLAIAFVLAKRAGRPAASPIADRP